MSSHNKRFWLSWWQKGSLVYGWKNGEKVNANGDKFISINAVIEAETDIDAWALVNLISIGFEKQTFCHEQVKDWLPSSRFLIMPDWEPLTIKNVSTYIKK
jgi:hypothetical protein